MRTALWLAGLFSVAAALAIFAGSNPGTVTVYWAPYRIDLSLNLVLLTLLLAFVVLHLALRAVSIMFSIPAQARRWRLLQKERAIHTALLESLSHLFGGRFIRARKSAERVLALEASVAGSAEPLAYAARLRALSHLLAAESAHALQDRTLRDVHFRLALEHAVARDAQDTRDGVQLRAARWAFDDRDAKAALDWLAQLPLGAARRTLALRLRFKAARLAKQSLKALELARLLTKHRAFSEMAGHSIARGLAIEHLRAAHDPAQLERAWSELESQERLMPDVAMQAAEHLLQLGGDAALARLWLRPVWETMAQQLSALSVAQRVRLARVLEASFGDGDQAPDADWLRRIETLQMANPGDGVLQYLAAVVCLRLSLWGKAQQLLRQSLSPSQDSGLRRDAWRALAFLAEQRQDSAAAIEAYRQALKDAPRR
jgi:HemY protein